MFLKLPVLLPWVSLRNVLPVNARAYGAGCIALQLSTAPSNGFRHAVRADGGLSIPIFCMPL